MEQNRLYGAGVGKRGIIALHIMGGGAVTIKNQLRWLAG